MTASEHEYYEQLCALVPAGTIPSEEMRRLGAHLAECEACRGTLADFRELSADLGAFLTNEAAGDALESILDDPRKRASARSRLMARIQAEDEQGAAGLPLTSPKVRQPHQIFQAAAVLVIGVSLGTIFVWGSRQRSERNAAMEESKQWKDKAAKAELLAAAADAQLEQIDRAAHREVETAESRALMAEGDARREEVKLSETQEGLRAQIADLEQRSAMLAKELDSGRTAGASLEKANEKLASDLAGTQRSLRESQAEIARFADVREKESRNALALETQVRRLQDRLTEQSQSVARGEKLLQTDRDIRDLMGARNLHVVDVFDVDTKGRLKAPFGRVFYTEGKSLVFYAFDLGTPKGSTRLAAFQAWGESDQGGTSNLGILYADNVNQNRWMLQFDDPKVLADLQAVYVTVEPPGGSKQPSGRKLLVANFGSRPNHP
jgi:hypothetical protein